MKRIYPIENGARRGQVRMFLIVFALIGAVNFACAQEWKSGIVWPKLQGTVIPVFEQGFTVNPKEFFRFLDGDPSW